MTRKIKYIGFYDTINEESKRNNVVSATNKMDYIISALIEKGIYVQVISPAWYVGANSPITGTIKRKLNKNSELIQLLTDKPITDVLISSTDLSAYDALL